jgi:hypothetical protein
VSNSPVPAEPGPAAARADGRRRSYEWADPAPSAAETGRMLCEGTVDHLGSRTALATARLTGAGGKLFAQATSNCMIFRPGG